jgi:predicted dehydrogenase
VPGAGQFYSLGPHLIDQALHCFGRPTKVTAFIQNVRGMGDLAVDDDVSLLWFRFLPLLVFWVTLVLD